MIRINELQLPLDHPPEALRRAILARLKIADADLTDFTVFKRSYDARKKNSEITFVYIIDAQLRDEKRPRTPAITRSPRRRRPCRNAPWSSALVPAACLPR